LNKILPALYIEHGLATGSDQSNGGLLSRALTEGLIYG
jgi:hypothetical protein